MERLQGSAHCALRLLRCFGMMRNLQLICASLLSIFGCLLMMCGFWVDPTGNIDPTVLTASGEVFTFSGSLFGIDYHYRYKQKG